MSLYHFHVSDGGRPDLDTQGVEFASPAAARAGALRFVADVLRDRAGRSDPEGPGAGVPSRNRGPLT